MCDWVMVEKLSRGSEMSGESRPITAVCIVADKNKCPPGFSPIGKTHDDQTDADLWKEFAIFNRAYRYLAVSRELPRNVQGAGLTLVTDICIVNEKDYVPRDFVAIDSTADSKEKALRKKFFCIRTSPRDSAIDAVLEVIILARQKKAPMGYSLAGELDGLVICFKHGVIPADFGRPAQRAPLYPPIGQSSSSDHVSSLATHHDAFNPRSNSSLSVVNAFTIRAPNHNATKGIDGVPFQLNPMMLNSLPNNQTSQLPELKPVDMLRLERDFGYAFSIERATLS